MNQEYGIESDDLMETENESINDGKYYVENGVTTGRGDTLYETYVDIDTKINYDCMKTCFSKSSAGWLDFPSLVQSVAKTFHTEFQPCQLWPLFLHQIHPFQL